LDKKLLYEGKAKKVYDIGNNRVLMEFKDSLTAFNGQKKGSFMGKGELNARITNRIFSLLEGAGVPTALEEFVEPNSLEMKALKMYPVEVVLRNIIAGSMAKRLGLKQGTELKIPIIEYYFKSDELGDPWINESHIYALGYVSSTEELSRMKSLTLRINEILKKFFRDRGMILVDFKLEFGKYDGEILLGDEFTPDTCRLWDASSGDVLDKDRFRRDMGKVEWGYEEVWNRIKE